MQSPAWKLGLIIAGTLAFTLVLGCLLGSLAIEHQFIPPPAAEFRLGGLWFLAGTTTDPTCAPGAMPCRFGATRSQQRFYSVWMFVVTERAGVVEIWERNLVSLPLGP